MKNLIYLLLCFSLFAELKTNAQPTQTPNNNSQNEATQGPLAASFDYQIYCLTAIFTNTSLNAIGFIWAFGNGDTILTQHPTYVYEEPGEYPVALTAINTNGGLVTFIDTITVDYCAALPTFEQKQKPLVYPNPASQNINFSLPTSNHTHTLIVYDSKGEKVYEKKNVQNLENIAINNWNAGIYMYAILDENMKIVNSDKILVKK